MIARCAHHVIALAVLAGCGGTPHLALRVPAAEHAVIEGVEHEWERFEAADGTALFAQCWTPRDVPPRGLLVVIHGIKDHSSRYAELATRVAREAQLVVCGMDHRGHGRSAGARVDAAIFDPYLDDTARFIERSRARVEPNAPVFLFGHSMGGALSVLLVTERHLDVQGVVLSAPALRVERQLFEMAATGVLAALAPDAAAVAAPDELFSRDPAVLEELRDDPLIYHPDHPARFGGAFLDGIARVWAHAEDVECAVLALHGTGDRLTDPRGSAELVRRARTDDATLRLYPGLYHDLVHEPEHDRVIADVVAWLRARAPSLDVGRAEVDRRDVR